MYNCKGGGGGREFENYLQTLKVIVHKLVIPFSFGTSIISLVHNLNNFRYKIRHTVEKYKFVDSNSTWQSHNHIVWDTCLLIISIAWYNTTRCKSIVFFRLYIYIKVVIAYTYANPRDLNINFYMIKIRNQYCLFKKNLLYSFRLYYYVYTK